jgi:hypothetical protein
MLERRVKDGTASVPALRRRRRGMRGAGEQHPSAAPFDRRRAVQTNRVLVGRAIVFEQGRNVQGSADLSCTTEAHTIAGHVDFAYCH